MLGAVVSVQCGAAAAFGLFDEIGPVAVVSLRLTFAALLLALIWRPAPRRASSDQLRLASVFGLTLAGMNLGFYSALDRIPLGIVVALEILGPLAVAVAASRRRLDLLWVALAAAGIVLLMGPAGGSPDLLGVAFALFAGACWGAYILLSARVGQAFSGGDGLALAMVIAALVTLAPGLAAGGADLAQPTVLAVGLAVAVLSSVVPYSLELEALRTLPVGVFGVLMSLEPAVAALVGAVALSQTLAAAEAVGIALVVAASAGALRGPGASAPTEA